MGSSQSLAGDLIRDGITGVAAHVSEPYLDGTIRPQILFPAYLAGFNLAESFYLAMPFLSWQTVVVGDPLCAPFSSGQLASPDTTARVDPDTGFPPIFSAREIALASKGGLNVDAVRLGFKGNVAAAAGRTAEAEALWVRSTELEPRLVGLQARLAAIYDAQGEYDKAIDRYRLIVAETGQQVRLTSDPFEMTQSPLDGSYSALGNPVALNNLAYDLAVHANDPKDALIFAKRAYSVEATPVVADTLGWVEHLLSDDAAAKPLLERASAGRPKDAEILFHVAVVHAALGDKATAKQELDAAEKLDPKLAARDDVKALRAFVGSSPASA
jgi:tetratricopeptide (TPR) repeat protein